MIDPVTVLRSVVFINQALGSGNMELVSQAFGLLDDLEYRLLTDCIESGQFNRMEKESASCN